MKTKFFYVMAMVLLITMTGCKKSVESPYSEYFDADEAVSLKELIELYDEYTSIESEEDDDSYDLYSVLYGKEFSYDEFYNCLNDTTFALYLPEYISSSHPFLSRAETFYNSCLLVNNIWTDFDYWLRFGLDPDDSVVDSIRSINEDCIRDNELRDAARVYKDSIVAKMQRSIDGLNEDENVMEPYEIVSSKITSKSYCFYSDEQQFHDSLGSMQQYILAATKPMAEKAMNAGDNGVRQMLCMLNDCSTFDYQCSLLLNWVNNPCSVSGTEDEWIVAVADRLIKSDKYNPCLHYIWILWRSMFQLSYCGASQESSIPNSIYNDMRKKCYLTCLKRIERHPEDMFAMNCAAAIGGRMNINRQTYSVFGNDASVEMYYTLPGRFETEGEGDE